MPTLPLLKRHDPPINKRSPHNHQRPFLECELPIEGSHLEALIPPNGQVLAVIPWHRRCCANASIHLAPRLKKPLAASSTQFIVTLV